ncbi:MAG TPA: HAMP domain-containing sensor histidine kinase [Byssovorax sp.]
MGTLLAATAALAGLAYWDESREAVAALDDFAGEQRVQAAGVASEVEARLGGAAQGDGDARALLAGAVRLERPGHARVLLRAPGASAFVGIDGAKFRSAPLDAAFARGDRSTWLERSDAAALGLSPRRAAAGLAAVDAGSAGVFAIAVVESAERERDREARARARLVSSVALAVALAIGAGVIALRRQRRELDLARDLDLAAAQRERDARLAAADRAAVLGTLAMGIAHEVGTPLGVIAGRAEQLAQRVADDERSARAVAAIAEQAERIRRVVRGFLDLARGADPVLGALDPGDALRAAVALCEHRFAAARVAIQVEVAPTLHAIHGDAAMLEQAIVNLLLNACEASPRGGRVDARASQEGGRIVFEVIDDGEGITDDAAARATEPFFTTKPAGQGTGIGLAIASEIVKLHRGELVIAAADGRGTRAAIGVPARDEAAS